MGEGQHGTLTLQVRDPVAAYAPVGEYRMHDSGRSSPNWLEFNVRSLHVA